jgi:zinc D-Ala-D-Ala carboxypeptidase
MNISEHITMREATFSPTAERLGISNIPNTEQLNKMKDLADNVFEPLRAIIGKPIKIESFFRSPELNKAIGGAVGSQHMNGEAMDLDDDYGGFTNKDLFYSIINNRIPFDQLIWEFGNGNNPDWVHVSYVKNANRNKISIAYKQSGVTKYTHFGNITEFEAFKNKLYK